MIIIQEVLRFTCLLLFLVMWIGLLFVFEIIIPDILVYRLRPTNIFKRLMNTFMGETIYYLVTSVMLGASLAVFVSLVYPE